MGSRGKKILSLLQIDTSSGIPPGKSDNNFVLMKIIHNLNYIVLVFYFCVPVYRILYEQTLLIKLRI